MPATRERRRSAPIASRAAVLASHAGLAMLCVLLACSRPDAHPEDHSGTPQPSNEPRRAPEPAAPKSASTPPSATPSASASPVAAATGTQPSGPAPTTPPAIARFSAKLAKRNADTVELNWDAPVGTALVRVVRSSGALEDPDDANAVQVYAGTAARAPDVLPREVIAKDRTGDPAAFAVHYAAFACRTPSDCDRPPARAVVRPHLIEALRKGGYALFLRHTTADLCQDVEPLGKADVTEKPGWWKSCDRNCATATARQLGDRGIAEAKQLGADFARLKLPIGRVLSSEFCRNVQTAKLIAARRNGKAVPIETLKDLTSFVYDEKLRCENTAKLLAQPPAPGTNVLLVGQKGNDCTTIGGIDSGETAVFKLDAAGALQRVANVKWSDWASYE